MHSTSLRRAAAAALFAGAIALTPTLNTLRAQAADTGVRATTGQTTTTTYRETDRDDDDHGKWGLAGLLGLLGLLGMRRREPDRVVHETRTTTDPNVRR